MALLEEPREIQLIATVDLKLEDNMQKYTEGT
jgi:hypothetical protein